MDQSQFLTDSSENNFEPWAFTTLFPLVMFLNRVLLDFLFALLTISRIKINVNDLTLHDLRHSIGDNIALKLQIITEVWLNITR